MRTTFFCIPKTKKVYSEEELELKQIEAELKQLKKQRKQLISPNITQIPTGVFFMGAPVIPASYFNTDQNINSKELMSVDRKIDRLIEAKHQIISNTTTSVSPT